MPTTTIPTPFTWTRSPRNDLKNTRIDNARAPAAGPGTVVTCTGGPRHSLTAAHLERGDLNRCPAEGTTVWVQENPAPIGGIAVGAGFRCARPDPAIGEMPHRDDPGTRRQRRRQRPGCRTTRGGRIAGLDRTAGDPAGRQRAETGLVLAGHRHPARRRQADRAPQARWAKREAMLSERFTTGAQAVVGLARDQACRLGHHWAGCEHLLIALWLGYGPASGWLRDQRLNTSRPMVARPGVAA
jgi:hypothetical protein